MGCGCSKQSSSSGPSPSPEAERIHDVASPPARASTSSAPRPPRRPTTSTRPLSQRKDKRLKQPVPWTSPTPLTRAQLDAQREEFWFTSKATNDENVWAAIEAACKALCESDTRPGTEDGDKGEEKGGCEDFGAGLGTAQLILNAAEITTPNGKLENLYDVQGRQYVIPQYAISNPTNLLLPSFPDANMPSFNDGLHCPEYKSNASLSTDSTPNLPLSSRTINVVSVCHRNLTLKLGDRPMVHNLVVSLARALSTGDLAPDPSVYPGGVDFVSWSTEFQRPTMGKTMDETRSNAGVLSIFTRLFYMGNELVDPMATLESYGIRWDEKALERVPCVLALHMNRRSLAPQRFEEPKGNDGKGSEKQDGGEKNDGNRVENQVSGEENSGKGGYEKKRKEVHIQGMEEKLSKKPRQEDGKQEYLN